MSGCLTFGPDPLRDRLRTSVMPIAVSNMSRVTMASCVGSSDHTQASGGLTLPPFLVARRFHTM